MALKKGINVRHGMQFGDRGATSASELAYDANTTTKQKIDALATEVAGKQDTLTFDDTPTDGSNNPVKSNGIYGALATKANTDIVASDFNATVPYTAGNYCIYDGKFYRFKNSHSGAWSAADVDEIKIAGELSSLKSGLTNVSSKVVGTITYTSKTQASTNDPTRLIKNDRVVQLWLNAVTTDSLTQYVDGVAILPEGFRPDSVIFAPCFIESALSTLRISTDGYLIVIENIESGSHVTGLISFIV